MLMELEDLDLDGSWQFDQIAFASSSSSSFRSPVVFSSSEHPCSPLWTFSDTASASGDGGGELCFLASAAAGTSPRLSDHFLACTPRSEAETAVENRGNGKLPSPFWRMMPLENPDSHCAIKARMTQALRYLKESTGQQHVLAQVWAPVKNHGRDVLTTSGQPFVLDPTSNGLNQYRMVSLTYMFSVDSEMDGELGLPGRVFRKKLPEWTPNVQYYSSKEFSRLVHALHYNIQGTLALPVFEPSKQVCLGVVELIMTSQKINYAPEVEKVCKALEAVNLKTSEILNNETAQICNEGRQNALAEILEILTVVCEAYKLPLAQTWVPCRHRSVLAYGGGFKKSCSSFDGSCMGSVCMSTSDLAFYVVDAHTWGFREACVEHHLQKGQGVAGRAFLSGSLCFCRDVTRFCKTDYPLVHYARMFKLTSCFAICLQSTHTGYDEYVLEFFLPPTIADKGEQDCLLGSLLATMRQHFRSLKVVSGIEPCEDEASVEVLRASEDEMHYTTPEPIRIHRLAKTAPRSNASLHKDDLQHDSPENKLLLNSDPMEIKVGAMECEDIAGDLGRCDAPSPLPEDKVIKKSERKRGKVEKSISLEVLQQYFAGSLKDAAKSLGVCPTTMKRICRQHGISRWPSRKINKVNRSLTKLRCVIDSVQGADGPIDLTSFSSSPLPIIVGSISWAPNPRQISPVSRPLESQPTKRSSPNCKSPRSCFQDVKTEHCDGTGSGEDTAGSSTSHGYCEANPFRDNISGENPVAVPTQEQSFTVNHPSEKCFQLSTEACSPHPTFKQMLVEDSGSSKELSNTSPQPTCDTTLLQEHTTVPLTKLHMEDKKEILKPVISKISIKATYRDDIIRFKISSTSGITELKQEVAKRLKLEVGTFDLKYLDDDNERVSVLCDADLRECLDISSSSGCSTVRLSVHDVLTNFGSSCESTEEE